MIPQLVTVRHHRRDGRRLRLFVPVLPVLLLVAPLLVLALLAGLVACVATGVRPLGALRGAGRLLWALPGTRFHIEYGGFAGQVNSR